MQDVVHLSIGQPDFPTPPHIVEAHIRALEEGRTRYELDAGLPALRVAVAQLYNQMYGISLTEENVLITTGCCQAMFMALYGVTSPGKEIIFIEPAFLLTHVASLNGVLPRRIITRAENGYQVDPQEVIDLMNENTCAIMLNSPGNPTGTIYPRETMEAIIHAAEERGIAVISDEVYDRLILDDVDYASALTCTDNLDNILVASSVSKSYSMAGLRLGWIISSKENIEVLQRFHMYISTTENTPTQYAVLTALTSDQSCVENMVAEYRRRRDHICDLIKQAPSMTGYKPGGAFFVMPSFAPGIDSYEVAMKMLYDIKVCTIPGSAFGLSCANALRISYATSIEMLDRAFDRMIPWLKKQNFR